jgi:ATP-dependent DNA ligase
MIFDERIKLLQELLLEKSNNTEKFKYLKLVDTTLVHSESESNELFKSYIKNKYEGIVYKNRNAIYEYSNIKEIRSHDYLKRKKNYEQEYPIIGFEEGSHGKDKGAIIFTMKTDNNKEFRAVPNMTLNKRKELYKIALKSFDTKFKNKLATISFDEFSKDNVPLRPKFITIRDYE